MTRAAQDHRAWKWQNSCYPGVDEVRASSKGYFGHARSVGVDSAIVLCVVRGYVKGAIGGECVEVQVCETV